MLVDQISRSSDIMKLLNLCLVKSMGANVETSLRYMKLKNKRKLQKKEEAYILFLSNLYSKYIL